MNKVFLITRIGYALLLLTILFIPFGTYHSTQEPYIIDSLWGFHLPVGYISFISSITVLLLTKSPNKKFKVETIMILTGLLLLVSLFLYPKEYSINLIHGTNFSNSQIDIDSLIGNTITIFLSIISIASGAYFKIKK